MRLKNKTVIITGASGGMGAVMARVFVREGARVVMADIFEKGGREVASELSSAGGDAIFVKMSVTEPDDWDKLLRQTESVFGVPDVLVNNAGLSPLGLTDPLSIDGWRSIMNVNADGTFYGTRCVVPAMVKNGGGSIVNISSIFSMLGSPGHPGYHSSKGAVRSLTKATAVSYGPKGIRCNSVHPGFMPPMRAGGASQDENTMKKRAGVVAMTPLRRLGESIDLANLVLFLASDESSFITGAEIPVDGGYLVQ